MSPAFATARYDIAAQGGNAAPAIKTSGVKPGHVSKMDLYPENQSVCQDLWQEASA